MKKTLKKITASLLAVLLLLCFAACGENNEAASSKTDSSSQTSSLQTESANEEKISVTLNITDLDGSTKTINTETSAPSGTKFTLYYILTANHLCDGKDSGYGYFVTAINGVVADGSDGSYWMFKDASGEYFPTGVETTEVHDGDVINIVREKS